MADTLVERLTGQVHAGDVDVEVQIVVPVEALTDPDRPVVGDVAGHGPVLADRMLGGRAERCGGGWSRGTGS